MMLERFALVDLAEDCGRVIKSFCLPSYEEARIFNCHGVGKRKLRTWKDANRNRGILRSSKPARASTKVACGQFVTNPRRPRFDSLKAVVTHLRNSPCWKPLQPHETLAHSQSSRITNPRLDKDWRSGGATRFTMSVSRKGPTSACPIKSRANLCGGYVRFGSKADILGHGSHVRFAPESGHLAQQDW